MPPIDWTRPEAVFSLCQHAGWTASELARRLGLADQHAVAAWWQRGCRRPARWGPVLDRLAAEAGFEAAGVLPDLAWTPARVRRAWRASGLTGAAFARAAGLFRRRLSYACHGPLRITRATAWQLTRAALALGLPLPPAGRRQPVRRGSPARPLARRPPAAGPPWTRDELAVLGTVPDREAARLLGTRSKVAVWHQRRLLGIPRVPGPAWDGTPRPCPVTLDEVLRRYAARLGVRPEEV